MIAVGGVVVTSLVIGGSVVGCGSNKSSTTSSSGSATSPANAGATPSPGRAPTADYTGLLIKDTDIVLPGDTFTAQPPTQNPNGQPGVATLFSNQNDTRKIGDDILILPDADTALSELDEEKAQLGNVVTGGTPAPAAAGTGGTMVSGTSPDGSHAVTVLLFTQGKAFTNLEFDSPPTDPVPAGFVADVGHKQDTAIKNGLHS
ncbi:MAG: hypothetical protein JOZ49_17825 [Mycolicibacterium sp.]|nr:hypothetical protein [Mycolicibacterium sp.]